MLANLAGTLIPAPSTNAARSSPSKTIAPAPAPEQQMSPTKEFLTFDTPKSRRETFILPKPSPVDAQQHQNPTVNAQPSTPMTPTYVPESEDFGSLLSPTTPYYLSKGAALVQQTCPPKPSATQGYGAAGDENRSKGIFAGFQGFPVSGDLGEIGDQGLRERLERARRRSLAWVPKVGSPLRGVSYGL